MPYVRAFHSDNRATSHQKSSFSNVFGEKLLFPPQQACRQASRQSSDYIVSLSTHGAATLANNKHQHGSRAELPRLLLPLQTRLKSLLRRRCKGRTDGFLKGFPINGPWTSGRPFAVLSEAGACSGVRPSDLIL